MFEDIENVHVMSDPHFNHANVIKYCDRPFDDVEEMNKTIVRFNNDVARSFGENYKLLILGDYGFGRYDSLKRWYDKMNGEVYLLMGNHDYRVKKAVRKLFGERLIRKSFKMEVCGMQVLFSHRPVEDFEGCDLNVHGHIHEKKMDDDRYINVCVERTNYMPFNLVDLIEDWKKCQNNS